ncbi:MAG: hypothetical protein U1U88_001479 [Lawsonella clevelandensis]
MRQQHRHRKDRILVCLHGMPQHRREMDDAPGTNSTSSPFTWKVTRPFNT